MTASYPARSAATSAELRLRMKGEGCGLLSPRCLTLGKLARGRIHSNQPAIFSMPSGLLTSVIICQSGPGIKTNLPGYDRSLFISSYQTYSNLRMASSERKGHFCILLMALNKPLSQYKER